ncbi:hypothetical protein K493DRAFT_412835 [Basidiobolus meristosporus CBS 931.73]|uniref:Uncharacterized protein n=1 Tax=Basidiobolus meristosporus CBS 931.73 TaxID=1314790 RepID=A0A1Y1VTM3_9FUNG|nr:hypothetical protein K493DRAFT_412835 [Basidiobolus meristosporus CBS 931.73]|eukprot:ORX64652.1 hypothetical protein K493DRAFT_412835 [Basidiobolus meristosporus CBS 931.73]
MSMKLVNSLPGWNCGPITSFESDIEIPSGGNGAPGLWNVVGFGDGYFGLQADSDSRRLATFSLFDLGESQKAEVADVGRNVMTQNSTEKPGKQAVMNINWQPGQRYRLRVDAIYSGQDTVFKATILVENQWQFVANITGKNFGSYNMWDGVSIHQHIDDMGENPSQTRTGIFGRQCYRVASGDFCYPNWGGYVHQNGGGYCWGSGLAGEGNAIFLSVGGRDPWPESCNYSYGAWLQYDNCAMDRLASEMNRK